MSDLPLAYAEFWDLGLSNQSARRDLAACEAVIERHLGTFIEVGEALAEIRDSRLYRNTHGTFEDYCRERWGFARNYANKMIVAAETVAEVGTNVPIANEAQARALGSIVREIGAEAAAEVLEEAAATGNLTASGITEAAKRRADQFDPEKQRAPHVSHNSGENEWYTPDVFLIAARATFWDEEICGEDCLGKLNVDGCDCPPITTDPASSDTAQQRVAAKYHYTAQTDGLAQEWRGNVWLNPPYSQPLIGQFVDKLLAELDAGNVRQAIVLVNNATETDWGQKLIGNAAAVCFPKGRVRFLDPSGNPGAPLQGQMVVYLVSAEHHEWHREPNAWSDEYWPHISDSFASAFAHLGPVQVGA